MPMLSYSQNGEDVLLNRLFPEGGGFYIDVGANDPVDCSVTKHFYDRGWRGINIEPEPAAFGRMVAGRPEDLNLNLGISDSEGIIPFFEAPRANGWSTFSPQQAANLRAQQIEIIERPIPVTTLAKVCEQHVRGPIDFLKVDAESHETAVMAGANWARWRPRVILIEANGMVHWEPGLLRAGYHFALFDGVNRFYVRAEDRHLIPRLATMANCLDEYVPHAHARVIQVLEERLATIPAYLETIRVLEERLAIAEAGWRGILPLMRKVKTFSGRQLRKHPLLGGSSKRAG